MDRKSYILKIIMREGRQVFRDFYPMGRKRLQKAKEKKRRKETGTAREGEREQR